MRIPDIKCYKCGSKMLPVWFTEEEEAVTRDGCRYKTGRKRIALSHLECPDCFTVECVDDSFDGQWWR